jgi:hypothetical protein
MENNYYEPVIYTLEELYYGRKMVKNDKEKKYKSDKILCVSAYQRADIFNDDFVEDLARSLVKRIPIGIIFLHKIRTSIDGKKIYCITEGRQRTSAIMKIIDNFFDYTIFKEIISSLENMYKDVYGNSKGLKKYREMKKLIMKNKNMIDFCDEYDDILIDVIKMELNSSLIKNIETIMEELYNKCRIVLETKIQVYEITGNENYAMEIFEKLNRTGTPLTEYDIMAATWSREEYITSKTPELVTKMESLKNKIVEGEEHMNILEKSDKRLNYSPYIYIKGLDEYYAVKCKSYNFFRKDKEEKQPFKCMLRLVCIILNEKKYDNIPKILHNKFSVDKLVSFEKKLKDTLTKMDSLLLNLINFTKTSSSSFVKFEDYLTICEYIAREDKEIDTDKFNKNKFLLNYVFNKLDKKEILNNNSDVEIKEIYNEFVRLMFKKSNEVADINTKAILYILYNAKYEGENISSNKYESSHIISKTFLNKYAKGVEKINKSHLGNLCLIDTNIGFSKNNNKIESFIKESSDAKKYSDIINKALNMDLNYYDNVYDDMLKKNIALTTKISHYDELMKKACDEILNYIITYYFEKEEHEDDIEEDIIIEPVKKNLVKNSIKTTRYTEKRS